MPGKLTALFVKNVKTAGRYVDGDGLCLEVKASGSKSWVARLQWNGRRRDYGLGSVKLVDLSEARDQVRLMRRQLRDGLDPIRERGRRPGPAPTFSEAATSYHEENKRGWSNGKHVDQWLATLRAYAFPTIGKLRVDQIETGHVRDLLAAVWRSKPETARRVRQRIKTVLDYAQGKNWRQNAFSMDAVNRSLPRQVKAKGHFKAVPVDDIPKFFATLHERESVARLALEALILTAVRSATIRGARWREIDLVARVWTIPAPRTKTKMKEHVVPLSEPVINVFQRAVQYRREDTDLVFPGLRRGMPLSDNTLRKMMRDIGRTETVHGCRSTFRDWVADKTEFSGEVAEAALEHEIKNPVEAAYRRTNYLEKRRPLMEQWAAFCLSKTD